MQGCASARNVGRMTDCVVGSPGPVRGADLGSATPVDRAGSCRWPIAVRGLSRRAPPHRGARIDAFRVLLTGAALADGRGPELRRGVSILVDGPRIAGIWDDADRPDVGPVERVDAIDGKALSLTVRERWRGRPYLRVAGTWLTTRNGCHTTLVCSAATVPHCWPPRWHNLTTARTP